MLLLHFVMCMNDILLNGKATIVGIYFPILMAYYLIIPNCELPSCLLQIFSCIPKWWFPGMGVPPNHPFIDGFSMINHPAIGVSAAGTQW